MQYFVQAVDANGNVAVSTNKGFYYQETPPTPRRPAASTCRPRFRRPRTAGSTRVPPVVVTVDGAQPAPGTATLSIDGGAPVPYTGPVTVTGDGLHRATAETATGSGLHLFLVDGSPPTVTFRRSGGR